MAGVRMPALSSDLSTLTVLCVEGDEATRAQLEEFLRGRFVEVTLAADGGEGLARFLAERPALVVADLETRDLDGLTLAREIHRLAPGIPVIATTTFDDADHLRRAVEVGVEHLVPRPIDLDQLERALTASARRLRGEAALDRALAGRAQEREAIGLLAGGMAHDFNNHLQSVVGSVELALALAEPGSEQQALAEAALEASVQAIALSRRLSLLSQGCYAEPRAVALGPILEAALTAALAGSETRRLVELPVDLPLVMADREVLGRALEELARNAREAMDDGGALLVRGAVREVVDGDIPRLSAGRYCELAFHDEGPGVPEPLRPKLFEACLSTKPRTSAHGMGLGLALVRAIVHRHRGSVSLAPPGVGEGSVFTVLLPAHTP